MAMSGSQAAKRLRCRKLKGGELNLEGHPDPVYLKIALETGVDIPAKFMMPIYGVSEGKT